MATNDNPSRTITLFCWILDVSELSFSISIDNAQTVDDLKKAILKENLHTLPNLDPHQLVLWKTSIPIRTPHILKNDLAKQQFEDDDALPEARRLRIIFPHPEGAEETLSTVIRVPSAVLPPSLPSVPILALNCFVKGDNPNQIFPVKIANTESVGALRDAIKEKKKPQLDHVTADSLKLWNASIPDDNDFEDNVSKIVREQKMLSPMDTLSGLFSKSPTRKHVHIIVRSPPAVEPPSQHAPTTPHQPSEMYRRLVNATRQAPTPSILAKSSTYAEWQGGTDPIYDGRYAEGHFRDTLALPAMFYNPAFAHFLDEIDNPNLDIPDDKIKASSDFIIQSSAIYSSENDRRDAFLPHLNKAIGHIFLTLSNSDKTQPDGVVVLNVTTLAEFSSELLRDAIILAIREDKNEIGKAHSDPSIQAIMSMIRFWVQRQRDGVRNVTCCPTIAIAIAGPFIMAMAVVITDKVIVQRLTDYIYTGREMDFDSHCVRVAKLFHAVGRCISRLGDYYAGISPSLIEPDSKHPRFFPSITSYGNDTSRSFRYVRFLEEDPSCVTFLAEETDGGRLIVVKFVQRYGIAAHRLLAPRFAPDVLYFGPVGHHEGSPSYGKYQMVVMEWINGESAAVLIAQEKLSLTFTRDVRDAIDLLHEANYVFGDLRLQNIMVCHDGKIKLVDFDWASIHGQGKYPAQMNLQSIQWPRGVGPQEVMLMEHDNEMLDHF